MKYPLLVFLIIAPCLCVKGVDISQLFSTATYQCMKNNNFEFAIPRGFYSYGALAANVVHNLQNAKAAGLITDIYMFPCRGKSASAQVDTMISGISNNLYGMVWIDVETNPSSGCGWGKDYSANCQYV